MCLTAHTAHIYIELTPSQHACMFALHGNKCAADGSKDERSFRLMQQAGLDEPTQAAEPEANTMQRATSSLLVQGGMLIYVIMCAYNLCITKTHLSLVLRW